MWYGSLNDFCSLYQEEIVALLRKEMKTLDAEQSFVQYTLQNSYNTLNAKEHKRLQQTESLQCLFFIINTHHINI